MRSAHLLILLCLCHVSANGQAKFYDYPSVNKDNLGVYASLSGNFSGGLIVKDFGASNTAKGTVGIVPSIGFFYQKHIGERLSFRGGFSFGYASYGYKYAQKFDSFSTAKGPFLSDNFSDYTKVKHGSVYVMPQIDFGYIFGPIRNQYLIEFRAGVGLQTYLAKSKDSAVTTSGTVSPPKESWKYQYYVQEYANYGTEHYGSLVGTGYLGLRWQNSNEFLNHLGFGLLVNVPVYVDKSGISQIYYLDGSYNTISKEHVNLSLFSFGFRVSYVFL
ncbi:MAG: hypothetical protein QM642_06455 [Edaphocola sp.]